MTTTRAIGWAALAIGAGVLAALAIGRPGDMALLPVGTVPPSAETPPAPPEALPETAAEPLARLRSALAGGERLAEAAGALPEDAGSEAADLLLEAFRSDGDLAFRASILAALERLGGEAGVEALARIAREEPAFADQARIRLSRVDGRSAARALADLVEEEGRKGGLAEAAARALGRARLRSQVPLLVDLVRGARDEGVRVAAAEALGDIGDPEAVEALGEALERDSAPLRRAALRSLGVIRARRAREILEAFVAREDVNDRDLQTAKDALSVQRGEPRGPPFR